MNIMLWKHGINDGTTGELPHTGLGVLARDIKSAGHTPLLIDNHFSPEDIDVAFETVRSLWPDLLCISLVTQEWSIPTVQEMIDLAVELKIPVWIGGPHAYSYSDFLVEDDRLTKIIIGEADGHFAEILASEERVMEFPRAQRLHFPDFVEMYNRENLVNYPMFISRGCKFNCTFCAATKARGNRWRSQPLDKAFWYEIDAIEKYFPKVQRISIIDDAFTNDLEHAKSFLKEYIRRGYPYQLNIFNIRADQMDVEFLELLKICRVETLAIGIESGDPEVFQMLKKAEKLETIEWAIGEMQKVGINPWLNMIIGLPGDSPEAHARSMAWVDKIPKPYVIQWLHYAPYRNTWAYKYYVDRGDIEDGFMPGLQGGVYEDLPEIGLFDADGFSRHQKMLAQLQGYLKCGSPILVLNYKKIRTLCEENGMMDLYNEWCEKAPIRRFIEETLPNKVAKGQIAASCLEEVQGFLEYA